jgi:protein arginine kinase activator
VDKVKCQECHEQPATLHFTKIINGTKTEKHLCEHCARDSGEFVDNTNSFSIHQLLSGLLNIDQAITPTKAAYMSTPETACSRCGLTYATFSKTGRFGCSNCYEVFETKLDPLLKKVHSGNTTHTGKIPKRIGKHLLYRKEIQNLKNEMQHHIEKEEFEKAAELRDKVRMIEKRFSNNGEE